MTSPQFGKPMKEKIPSGYKAASLQQFTPEQMQLFSSLFPHLGEGSYLSKLAGGDESMFEQIERPAFRQFGEQMGGMASRFSGMGQGARRSSGFQNAGTQAASDFSMNLQSQRQGLQRQALTDLMGMSQSLMGQRPYETSLVEKPKPWWQEALTGFAQGAGQGAGKAMFSSPSALGAPPGG